MTFRPRRMHAVALDIALFLSGCGTTYPEDLEALRDDPMAGAELVGGEIVQEFETEASVAFTKPTFAKYQTQYRALPGTTMEELKTEAVAKATEAGWAFEDPNSASAKGTKELATGAATIFIGAGPINGEQRLVVALEHDFNHPG